MLFNSIDFAIFLPVCFVLYWFVTHKNLRLQNSLIVLSSFIFYGWWDWRFLFLMVGSASIDYFVSILLKKQENKKKRKILLAYSIIANLGILAFFKYFNFFVDNFIDVFTLFGTKFNPITLNIVLPVGISFYTFQALSYTIDVYRKKLEPTNSIIDYFAFISFFPQLVAGPIERATNLLPQFYKKRIFDYDKAVDGMRQILWGLFKKIVVADGCAEYVNNIFGNYTEHSGSSLALAAILFGFQIYCDFSGYSDIAIGTARLFGFNIMQNFAFPYFSRDIAEFWRRWHISLSTWFRDYVYIPLGGSKGNNTIKIRNIFVIFLLSGFWHGANLTFIVWGALNAIYFLPLLLFGKNRNNLNIVAEGKLLPSIKEIIQITATFGLTTFAWIFFRSKSLTDAFSFIGHIFSPDFFTMPVVYLKVLIFILILVIIEWIQRKKRHALDFEGLILPSWFKISIYVGLSYLIMTFGTINQSFIYFQF